MIVQYANPVETPGGDSNNRTTEPTETIGGGG